MLKQTECRDEHALRYRLSVEPQPRAYDVTWITFNEYVLSDWSDVCDMRYLAWLSKQLHRLDERVIACLCES